MTAILEVSNVSVAFGGRQVVSDVSIRVEDGEIAALIGPSGCGKTTLLRVVAGIIPTLTKATLTGEVAVLGKSPRKLEQGQLDVVFQESSILSWRTAFGNIGLALELHRNGYGKKSPTELLELIGLSGYTGFYPGQLSGGMRQRVSLASALITGPKLLLMDEPFANLDSLTRESLWVVMQTLIREKYVSSVLMVTHSIEEAVVLADTVHVMSVQPGHIIASVKVALPRPRIYSDGLFCNDFGPAANEVRAIIRNGGST